MGFGRYRINWGNETYFEEVETYFDALQAYSKNVGGFVDEQVKNARTRYTSVQQVEEEHPYSFEMLDEYGKYLSANRLSDILFDSCIVGTMSFIERKLLFLCKELETKNRIKLSDTSGKGIRKFHLYLTKVCDVKTDEVEVSWAKLRLFNDLRNILVHSHLNRVIPKNRGDLLSMLRETPGVRLVIEAEGFSLHVSDDTIVQEQIRVGRQVLDHAFMERVS